MLTNYNITGYQGDYLQLTLNAKENNNTPLNLSGYGIRGQVRTNYGATGVLLDLNPTISGDGTSGVILININSSISADLPVSDHIYDIERYVTGVVSGNSIKLIRGKFSILPEVTR